MGLRVNTNSTEAMLIDHPNAFTQPSGMSTMVSSAEVGDVGNVPPLNVTVAFY